MSKSLKATKALTLAENCEDLQEALVIGMDSDGGLQLFTSEVDRAEMVVILERAKLKILNTIGQDSMKKKGQPIKQGAVSNMR